MISSPVECVIPRSKSHSLCVCDIKIFPSTDDDRKEFCNLFALLFSFGFILSVIFFSSYPRFAVAELRRLKLAKFANDADIDAQTLTLEDFVLGGFVFVFTGAFTVRINMVRNF